MKIVIYILALTFITLLLGRTEIRFNPFSINMEGWRNLVGWILVVVGIGFLCQDSRIDGYEKGITDSIEYLKSQIYNDENRN